MKELNLLIDFLNDLPEKGIDFYPVTNTFSRQFLEKANLSELKIIGRTQADCLVGLLMKKKEYGHDTKEGQIVWIDSEGEPNAVIAENIKEFISLLYFDTGFIYDIIKKIIRNINYTPMTTDEIKMYEISAAKAYPSYNMLKKFFETELKIRKPDNPDMLIKKAYTRNMDFSNWLNNVTGTG